MKLFGGKSAPSKKSTEQPMPLTPEEQAQKKRLERRKKVARRRQTILFGGIALATIAIVVLLFNIFVRPPDVSTESTEPMTDKDGNIILPTDGQPSLAGEDKGDRKKDYYTFLLCGLDQDKTRADTIMAVSYDVPNGVVNVMNIPRDTIVDVNRSIKKINSGFGKGIDNLKKEVKSVIGIPIDRYVIIDFKGFEEIVDAIGGVKYNVPVRMKYDDPTQDLHIDLQPGEQLLNGKKALHFVRFRKCNSGESGGYPGGDVERIQAQQGFIRSVLKQLASPSKLLKLDDVWDAVYENVDTDLSLSEIIWFGMRAITMNSENIHMSTMPGYDKYLYEADFGHMQSYYIPDGEAILEFVNANLNPYTEDITKLHLKDISGYSTSAPKKDKPADEPTTKAPTSAEEPTEATTTAPTEAPTEATEAPEPTTAAPTEATSEPTTASEAETVPAE